MAAKLDETKQSYTGIASASSGLHGPSQWHSAQTYHDELDAMRKADCKPGCFTPERHIQYIRGRPTMVVKNTFVSELMSLLHIVVQSSFLGFVDNSNFFPHTS